MKNLYKLPDQVFFRLSSLDQCTPVGKFRRELEDKRRKEHSEGGDAEFLSALNDNLEFLGRTRVEDAKAMPKDKPRLIKSHLPFSLLPPDLLQRNKARTFA